MTFKQMALWAKLMTDRSDKMVSYLIEPKIHRSIDPCRIMEKFVFKTLKTHRIFTLGVKSDCAGML